MITVRCLLGIIVTGLSLVACTRSQTASSPLDPVLSPESEFATPTISALFDPDGIEMTATPTEESSPAQPTTAAPSTTVSSTAVSLTAVPSATITIDLSAGGQPVDKRVLGTNLPAWLGAARTENSTFIARTIAAGVTLVRIPGGSWSNSYDWLACETGTNILGQETCWSWPWGLRPTDFINFIKATGTEAMYTVNVNGTTKEAAALVAFFNGAVDDDTEIGVDVWGHDWGRVSDWARLRAEQGNPDPLNLQYWEIGNEVYGGRAGMGTDCAAWGWEEVWTCDGREYVNGMGGGQSRRPGFLDFQAEMKKVDPTIWVGAVGVTPPDEWSDWGNEVIETAGGMMDFYIIHQYAFFDPPASSEQVLAQPQTAWQPLMADAAAAFDQLAAGRHVPIAITEHNLFSFQDQDNEQLMTTAVNLLFMADTLGQLMQNGVALANQWDLANGKADNGTDYGLLDADTFARSPQYYAFPLWARFGRRMLPVVSTYDPDATLAVYAGRTEAGRLSVLAINKTGEAVTAVIQFTGTSGQLLGGTADIVQADALDGRAVTFNGVADPADDLSDAPPLPLTGLSNPLSYPFPPYSLTLLQIEWAE